MKGGMNVVQLGRTTQLACMVGRSAGRARSEAESSLLRSTPLLSAALCGGVARALRRARPRQGRRRRRLCRSLPAGRPSRASLLSPPSVRPIAGVARRREREREWEKAAAAGDGWSEEDEDEQPVSPHEGRTPPPPSRPTEQVPLVRPSVGRRGLEASPFVTHSSCSGPWFGPSPRPPGP